MNVRNLSTNERKCVDFRRVSWEPITEDVLYSINDDTEVETAKQFELNQWVEYKVFDEVEDVGQEIITTRWVITKNIEKSQIKARLVARGFEEDSTNIQTDSPICKENLRLVSSLGLSYGWKMHTIDVKAAFLQGFPIDRTIYLLPPPEAATNKLWKLNTSVYGLCDASRAWYLKVFDELEKCGAKRSIYDNALFFLRTESTLLEILCSHVDDFYFVGSEHFITSVVQPIRNQFNLSREHDRLFKFLGVKMHESNDKISLNQIQYINSIEPILVNNITQKIKEEINRGEARQLKGLVGQLQWVAKQTRPDISFAACQLSTRLKDATYAEIRYATNN